MINNTRHISGNQDFIVPSDAPNGEYVGYVKAYPEFEMIGATPTFVLKTNVNGIYAVSSAGLITIASNTSLSVGSDIIVITVSKTGYADCDINITVLCLATTDCIYLDPTSGTNGVGTRNNPWNVFSNGYINDKNLLIKRGTTLAAGAGIGVAGQHNIIIGSYGVGARPIVTCIADEAVILPRAGATNITIRDIEGTSAEPAKSNPDADYGNWGYCFIYEDLSRGLVRTINCEWHHLQYGYCGFSGEGYSENVEINWNYIHDIAEDGIQCGVDITQHKGIYYAECNKVINVNMMWSYSQNQYVAAGDGIQFQSPNKVYIRHNYIDRSLTGNKFCIIVVYAPIGEVDGTEWTEISDNYLLGPYYESGSRFNVIYADLYRGEIFNNHIQSYTGHSNYGIFMNDSSTEVSVYNNLFLGCFSAAVGIKGNIYNNVFYDNTLAINITTGAPVNIKNNIFYYIAALQIAWHPDFFSTCNIDYNIYNVEQTSMFGSGYHTLASVQALGKDNHSIIGNPIFTSSSDFTLQSGSPAIGAGTNVGLTTDYAGNLWNATPSIGAYEYGSNSGDLTLTEGTWLANRTTLNTMFQNLYNRTGH